MLEWKLALFQEKDFTQATMKYQEAKNLAQLLSIDVMVQGFDVEWQEDLERFYQIR